jgi:hypothetical protein
LTHFTNESDVAAAQQHAWIHRAAASALSSGCVLKAIAARGAALRTVLEDLKSEVEIAIDAPEAAYGVVEGTVVRRPEILLDVARIVVISDINDLEPAEKLDAMTAEFEIEGILELDIETHERGEAAGFVSLPDVVPIGVQLGMRESGVSVEDGHKLELVGQANNTPEQDTIGSVAGKRAVLVGADEGIRKVSEELVVVVEFTRSARTDVAADDGYTLGRSPTKHGEKFIIVLVAGIEELELSGLLRSR